MSTRVTRSPPPYLLLIVEGPELVISRELGHGDEILRGLARRRRQRRRLHIDVLQRIFRFAGDFRRSFPRHGLLRGLFGRWFFEWEGALSGVSVPAGFLRRNPVYIVSPVRLKTNPQEILLPPCTCANECSSCKNGRRLFSCIKK